MGDTQGQLQPSRGQVLTPPYYGCYYAWLRASVVCVCRLVKVPPNKHHSLSEVWLTLTLLMSCVYLVGFVLCHPNAFFVIH